MKILILLLILITTVAIYSLMQKETTDTSTENFTPDLILDVRNTEEWHMGHGKQSLLIPLPELENRIKELKNYKNKNIIVVCRSGNRAGAAISILERNGFTNLKNGGAWENYKN
jgi:rhodanese-related sulfurtransferase